MPKNGTLRKKKRLKARRGMDRATGVADEGSDGTRPPRTALARGPTFADAPIPRGAAGTAKRPADDDARERLREERRQRKRAKRRGEAPPQPGSVAAAAAAAALPQATLFLVDWRQRELWSPAPGGGADAHAHCAAGADAAAGSATHGRGAGADAADGDTASGRASGGCAATELWRPRRAAHCAAAGGAHDGRRIRR